MHNEIQRDARYIHRLRETLHTRYGIRATDISPATRGYYGETWKVCADTGVYFLKLDALPFHQQRFRQSLPVLQYLCDSGIDFVGKLVQTREHALYAHFDAAIFALFEWLTCEHMETDETKAAEYQMLCNIYPLTRPGFDIPHASFSDGAAVRFYQQWDALRQAPDTASNRAILDLLDRFRDTFSHCAARLARLAAYCRDDPGAFYLTHGDAGGNFFLGNGKTYILDWDEVQYAPLERDAWVMGCFDWARTLFQDTLRANRIPYRLRPERLAFYCYHMYFFYLVEFLMTHPIRDASQRMVEYLETDGWIQRRIQFADTIG